jgi:CheY-like chemotaxis protein
MGEIHHPSDEWRDRVCYPESMVSGLASGHGISVADCIRVLVVDDQLRARQSLKALLATWPQLQEVREAANAQQALSVIEAFRPDVVLMDARMPGMDGVEATRTIKARWPQLRVIVLSMYAEYLDAALAGGADAFVNKGLAPEKLLVTLANVASPRP